jgi:hypothetical protein
MHTARDLMDKQCVYFNLCRQYQFSLLVAIKSPQNPLTETKWLHPDFSEVTKTLKFPGGVSRAKAITCSGTEHAQA